MGEDKEIRNKRGKKQNMGSTSRLYFQYLSSFGGKIVDLEVPNRRVSTT